MESQNNELTQNDLLNASIVFSQAISLMLDNGQGIIVDILPEMGIVLPEEGRWLTANVRPAGRDRAGRNELFAVAIETELAQSGDVLEAMQQMK